MDATFCPRCGTQRLGAFRFCRSCGFDFDEVASGTSAAEVPSILRPADPSTSLAAATPTQAYTPPARVEPSPPVSPATAPTASASTVPVPSPKPRAATRLSGWWAGLSRRGKILTTIITTAVVFAVIGSGMREPTTAGTIAVTPTPRAAAARSPEPTPTVEPTTEPVPTTELTLAPEVVFGVFKDAFEAAFPGLSEIIAPAIESDFYWIPSVDKMTYDKAKNSITVYATIDFESVYLSDPNEWHSDVWDLYQSWSRNVWTSYMDGLGGGSFDPDWPSWTPALILNGNAARLTASCPGSVIYGISQRSVTQADFLKGCAFKPK